MAHGVALKQRAIQPRTMLILDDDYLTNARTGEVYAHSRAVRRKAAALGDKVSTHEDQQRPSLHLRARRKARRKMAAASRRRNR